MPGFKNEYKISTQLWIHKEASLKIEHDLLRMTTHHCFNSFSAKFVLFSSSRNCALFNEECARPILDYAMYCSGIARRMVNNGYCQRSQEFLWRCVCNFDFKGKIPGHQRQPKRHGQGLCPILSLALSSGLKGLFDFGPSTARALTSQCYIQLD